MNTHRRNGKVARLPKELRMQVNRMMDEGATYPSIIHWLDSEGHSGFNEENLSNWHAGGYQDWLREQDRHSRVQHQREWAKDFLHYQEIDSVSEAITALIGTQLGMALERYNPDALAKLMEEKPETYFKAVSQFFQLIQYRMRQDLLRQAKAARPQSKSNQIKVDQTEPAALNSGVMHQISGPNLLGAKPLDETQPDRSLT